VFVMVQVLQAYPFHNGVFGDAPFFLGVTYTVSLEIFALLAALGVVLWAYTRASGDWQTRLLGAVGEASLIFGALVAGVVYVETRLLWGEILPGIHVWQGLPGGGGYPWGTEQVAYNTCFVPSVVRGDCEFLNYNELMIIALFFAMVGFVLWYKIPEESEVRPAKRAGILCIVAVLRYVTFQRWGWWANRDADSDSWNSPSAHKTQIDRMRQRYPQTEDEGRHYVQVRAFKEV